jgi:MarR family 2-MHQ and catechol resistance regulon transcriptional repressor
MPTHYQGAPEEVRALNVIIKLQRAAASVGGRLSGTFQEAGLTESQFGILETLYHLGPLHQRDLGCKLLRSSGNVTLVLDNLERRGLVERVRGTDDRRFVCVHLTAAGRRLIADLFPRHVAAVVRELAVLTPQEQDELSRLCRKLGQQEKS